jgi:hypothetical protein
MLVRPHPSKRTETPSRTLERRDCQSWDAGGHAVGFLGDGISDALALREADIGIFVDSLTPCPQATTRQSMRAEFARLSPQPISTVRPRAGGRIGGA